ncbi:VTT domain-containing protein [Ideonella sp. 4Y16]|uniref:DedA family protein n=1 Tax=Ideonella alba TaxID=2824118 RepID=UPI001B3919BA|nr:VTT domain-containing protein [Ideonella alba]MBQ0945448.1 VTT domain-containing protein [Ideonella alba]
MLSGLADWLAWSQAVLSGMATPAVIAGVLALTTLLLEDLAIAAGVALATQGAISWALSFSAVALGIALGDLGLYALGLGARRLPALRRRLVGERADWTRRQIEQRLLTAVLLARVIPGLRLATYTACGFLRVPFVPFTAWVLLAVTLWTLGLYALSAALGQALAQQLGLPAPIAVALPILVLALAVPLVRSVRQRLAASPTRP